MVHRVRHTLAAARSGYGFIVVALTAAFALWVLVWITEALGLEFRGTPVNHLIGNLVVALLVCSAVVYGCVWLLVHPFGRRNNYAPWADFARRRGLRATIDDRLPSYGMDLFRAGRDRTHGGLLRGRLACGLPIHVGTTSWTTGYGDSKERHCAAFALVTLPAEVGGFARGASVSRYMRGIRGANIDLFGSPPRLGSPLRLESTPVDFACNITVDGDADDPRWREVFDPVLLDGLAVLDVQMQQVGRMLLVVDHASTEERVAVQQMDTLCCGAALIAERYLQAAIGDVPSAALRQ